jgi:NAD(P)H-dependent flavin oxidoreductase YrpB (nitropropane dioxygenase family)
MIARDLANRFTKEYLDMKKSGANPLELSTYLNEHDQYQSQYLGQADEAEICCGQVAGLISEVQDADEVTRDIVENISSCFEELKQKLGDICLNRATDIESEGENP